MEDSSLHELAEHYLSDAAGDRPALQRLSALFASQGGFSLVQYM
jgi:hypothetical protein